MNVSPSSSEPQKDNDRYSNVTQQRLNRKRVSPSNTQNAVGEDVRRSTSLSDVVIEPPEGGGISDVSTDSIEYFDVIPKSEMVAVVLLRFEIIETVYLNL